MCGACYSPSLNEVFDVKYLNAVNLCRTYDLNFKFCNSEVFILLKELEHLPTCQLPLGLQGPSSF